MLENHDQRLPSILVCRPDGTVAQAVPSVREAFERVGLLAGDRLSLPLKPDMEQYRFTQGGVEWLLRTVPREDVFYCFLTRELGSVEQSSDDSLTKREKEVLGHLLEGKNAPQIAEVLVISPRTVNKHCENIYKKYGVKNRMALLKKLGL